MQPIDDVRGRLARVLRLPRVLQAQNHWRPRDLATKREARHVDDLHGDRLVGLDLDVDGDTLPLPRWLALSQEQIGKYADAVAELEEARRFTTSPSILAGLERSSLCVGEEVG